MVEIEACKIDTAYHIFCRVMGILPKNALWSSILEFSVFAGFGIFPNPDEPPLYPHDVRRKIDSVLGPHGETIIRAYKVRRNTITGRLWIPIKKAMYGMFLLYWVSYVEIQDRWRRRRW